MPGTTNGEYDGHSEAECGSTCPVHRARLPEENAKREALRGELRAALSSDPTRPHGPDNYNPRSTEHPDTQRAFRALERDLEDDRAERARLPIQMTDPQKYHPLTGETGDERKARLERELQGIVDELAAYRAADGAAKSGYDPLPAPLAGERPELRPDPVGSAETISEAGQGRVLRHVVSEHVYLSTACVHGEHAYCKAEQIPDRVMTGRGVTSGVRNKRPAECKFCEATCLCECHCWRLEMLAPDWKTAPGDTAAAEVTCGAHGPEAGWPCGVAWKGEEA